MAEEKNIPQNSGTEDKKIIMKFGKDDIEATIDKDGRIIMPEEVQKIMSVGMSVLKKAAENKTDEASNADAPQRPTLGDESVAGKFKGLPMRELIGAPLFAAAEAQEKLASIAWDYYHRIAYDDQNGGEKVTRLLEFTLNRPVVQDGVVSAENNEVKVQAPFIGLVPIPSLLIDRIDVDFQMEVTDTNSSTDNSSADASTNISSKWFGVNVGISGKVSSSRENTRSSNQTAKYQVHVTASQQPPTEGLSKLMDIMASCIEPVPTSGGK